MARWIDEVRGHETVWQHLLDLLASDHLPHALAFVGLSGIGKKKVALALAQAGVCSAEAVPCGVCSACLRIKNLQSESLFCVAPVAGTLKMDQAHEILAFLRLRSLAKRRFVIIDEASSMNPSFANSLLKILEEPPPGTHFIFISNAISQLLPTLRSRLQVVRFFPLSDAILAAKKPLEPWMITAAQGSFSQLEEWTLPEVAEMKKRTVATLSSLAAGQKAGFETMAAEIKDKDSALMIVRLLQQFFRDAVYAKAKLSGVIHADVPDALAAWSRLPKADLLKFWQAAFHMELDIAAHLDRTLLFENFYQKVRSQTEFSNAKMV